MQRRHRKFFLFLLGYMLATILIATYRVDLLANPDGAPPALAYTLGVVALTFPIWLLLIYEMPWIYLIVNAAVIWAAWKMLVVGGWRNYLLFFGLWIASGILYIGLRIWLG